jgi:hypothetical protein
MNRLAAAVALVALAPAWAAAQSTGSSSKPSAGVPPGAPTIGGSAATPETPGSSAGGAATPERSRPPASGGAASAGTSGAAPSKAAIDLAKTLTTQATWDGILDAYATSLTGQISAALGASGQRPAPDLHERIRADLHDMVRYDQAIQLQARALASRFSQDELGTLEKFYRSGPGKKLLDVLPDVSHEVNDDLRARLSERVPQIVQKHAPSLAAGGDGAGAGKSGTASGSGASSGDEGKDRAQGGTTETAPRR